MRSLPGSGGIRNQVLSKASDSASGSARTAITWFEICNQTSGSPQGSETSVITLALRRFNNRRQLSIDQPTLYAASIGKLRPSIRNKPKSPDFTGKLALQRSTFEELERQMRQANADEIPCNIAGWVNIDSEGKYLTVEISPLFIKRTVMCATVESLLEDDDDLEE
jgi:hypothetical protein